MNGHSDDCRFCPGQGYHTDDCRVFHTAEAGGSTPGKGFVADFFGFFLLIAGICIAAALPPVGALIIALYYKLRS